LPSLQFAISKGDFPSLHDIGLCFFCEIFRLFVVKGLVSLSSSEELARQYRVFEALLLSFDSIPPAMFDLLVETASCATHSSEDQSMFLSSWLASLVMRFGARFPNAILDEFVVRLEYHIGRLTPVGNAFLQALPFKVVSDSFHRLVARLPETLFDGVKREPKRYQLSLASNADRCPPLSGSQQLLILNS
jgi:hypothetical protein